MSEQLLTPAEAAAVCGVTPHTLALWVRAGKLPSITTAGGHNRYRRSDLTAAQLAARVEYAIRRKPDPRP